MNDRADKLAQRIRYMKGEITHEEYFEWLADLLGVTTSHLPVSKDTICNTNDPDHLNDIPLRLWDQQHQLIAYHARSLGLLWSVSDSVCVLKAVAKRDVLGVHAL